MISWRYSLNLMYVIGGLSLVASIVFVFASYTANKGVEGKEVSEKQTVSERASNLRTLIEVNFAEGQEGVDINLVDSGETIAALPTRNGYPLLSEKLNIFLKKPIIIEPGKTYFGRLVVRVLEKSDINALQPFLHAGSWNLVAVDRPMSKNALSLFVINERLPATVRQDSDGKISFAGIISAPDVKGVTSFPVEARLFRPFIGFNPEGSERALELVSYSIILID